MSVVDVRNLKKSFGENDILKGIDFTVQKGEVISIIGASGSGKSTLLRCINLLEEPTGGEIYFHGENVLKPKFNTTVYRAKMGMVFQQFNLFSNLSVLNNCIVGQTEVLKRSKAEAKDISLHYLEKVGMAQFINA